MIIFSKQAEDMISQMKNSDEFKKMIIIAAEKRNILITGSDIIRFMIKGDINANIHGGDLK